MPRGARRGRQRGVAVITALLLTTLAVTIVASLFWQQQVQVRSIENQRMQLQKQWILRGALDWARLILNESARTNQGRDDLQQAWAVGLAETRLDSYVENGRSDSEATDATITGKIIDAESYLNLAGLSQYGKPSPKSIESFRRLLTTLHIDPKLAEVAAASMAEAQPKAVAPVTPAAGSAQPIPGLAVTTPGVPVGVGTTPAPAAAPVSAAVPGAASPPRLMAIDHIEDLLAVPGFTPEIIAKLKNFAIILPTATTVNVNTASAEVLSATIGTLSLPDAQALVAVRDRIPFKSVGDFGAYFSTRGTALGTENIDVMTRYFIVDGKVKLNRAGLEVLALIERTPPPGVGSVGVVGPVASKVVWIREN